MTSSRKEGAPEAALGGNVSLSKALNAALVFIADGEGTGEGDKVL